MPDVARANVTDLDLLCLIARSMSLGSDTTSAVQIAVRQSVARFRADGGVVAVIGPGGTFHAAFSTGYPPEHVAAFAHLTVEARTPLTDAARLDEGVWVESRQEAVERFPQLMQGPTTSEAWAAVPLRNEHDPIGALGLSFAKARTFSEGDRLFLTLLADLTSVAIAQATHRHAADVSAANALDRLARKVSYVISGRVLLAVRSVNRVAGRAELDAGDRDRLRRAVDQLELLGNDVRSVLAGLVDVEETDDITTLDLHSFGQS